MKKPAASFGVSFLDLLSCALGASVILSVIFSLIKDPPQAPVIGEFILIAAKIEGNLHAGMAITPPGRPPIYAFPYSKHMDLENGTTLVRCWETVQSDVNDLPLRHLFVLVNNPTPGDWEVRPYAVSLIHPDQPLENVRLREFRFWTLSQDERIKDPESDAIFAEAPAFRFLNQGIDSVDFRPRIGK